MTVTDAVQTPADNGKVEDASSYLFHEEEPGVFKRRCFGIEELSGAMEEECDGFAHLTVSAAVKINASLSDDAVGLRAKARSAWIALRRQTPVIASRSFREADDEGRHFALRYMVPKSAADVDSWVDETIFFDTEPSELFDKHRALKDEHWWRCSDNRYVAEVHATPLVDGKEGAQWSFHLVFVHNCIDGRNAFTMLDSFLTLLSAEIAETLPSGDVDQWGEETGRLPPPGAFIPFLAESGAPPSLEAPPPPPAPEPSTSGETPSPPIPWLYPVTQTEEKGDITHLHILPEDVTARLCAATRAHGATINHVITALSALAHAEAMLAAAAEEGEERYTQVSSLYGQASLYVVAFNFINHRQNYPGGYSSYASPRPPPLCTCDGVPIFVPMEPLRASLTLPAAPSEGASAKSVGETSQRVLDAKLFWDGLVQAVSGAWKGTDRSLPAYFERERVKHVDIPAFTPMIFAIPALIVSSVGDLSRLDVLSDLTAAPPVAETPGDSEVVSGDAKPLQVTAATLGIRMRTAPVMNLNWTFRGQLHCHFLAAREHTRPETLERVVRAFEEWVKFIVQ